MTALRKDLPPLPRRMAGLPVDDRGYPVPWFVAWIDGKPDFRIIRRDGLPTALEKQKCWLCGDRLGRYGAFVIGPMCAIDRVSSEPPSHRDCAEFAVKACPFLVRPQAKRRDANLPETKDPAGEMLRHNPGVSLLWLSDTWRPFRARGGLLIDVGAPRDAVSWWRAGRPATRTEIVEAVVLASIEAGLPALADIAAKDGPQAVQALERETQRAMSLVPPA